MKVCPKCKSKISDTAKFCMKCGLNIQKYENENNNRLCPECGYDINKDIDNIDFSKIDKILDEKINHNLEEQSLSYFEYENYPTGGYIIKKFIDPVETDIVLPNSIVGIKDNAFENAVITSVKLNEGLKIIGKKAFANCKYLSKINIPTSVNRIEDEAFINCVKLDVIIPNTVKIKGIDIIKNTLPEILFKEKLAKEKALEEQRKKEEALRIEQERIKKEEEKRKAELAAIEAEKARIRAIELAKEEEEKAKLKAIKEAEKKKKALEEAKKKAEKEAIEEAKKKEKFLQEQHEKGIYIVGENSPCISRNRLNFNIKTNKQFHVTIADGVKEIYEEAFKNQNIHTLVMADTVYWIHEKAFAESNIENIVFSKSIAKLPSFAFNKAKTKVYNLPEKLKDLGYGCFSENDVLESVTTYVETIGKYAFEKCKNLKNVKFNSKVKSIGKGAFRGCSKLDTINLENVESIDEEAFRGCFDLKEVNLSNSIKKLTYESFAFTGLKSFTFPKNCQEIESRVFYYSSKLEKVIFSNNIKVLSSYCFQNCSKLKDVILPSSLEVIETKAFDDCKSLERIVLPSSLIKIEDKAFYNCENLKEISLPSGIKEVAPGAFNGCSKLEKIIVPANCEKYISIDGNLYLKHNDKLELIQYCEGKKNKSYTAPEKVFRIASDAAKDAHNLEEVILTNVTEVMRSAFENCDNISNIELYSKIEKIGSLAFRNSKKISSIKIPRKCVIESFDAFSNNCKVKKSLF